MLRRSGYGVDIYDRYDRIGGLLVYGIPNFKLEKNLVARRAKLLEDSGVTFHLNIDIGRDIGFQELRDKHDAILIATGVYELRDIKVPGAGLKNGSSKRSTISPLPTARDWAIAVAGIRRRQPRRGGQECRGDRRRRHGHGLRADRGSSRRQVGALPLPAQPREHAGLAARSRQCRRGRGGVRLAPLSRGFFGRRSA